MTAEQIKHLASGIADELSGADHYMHDALKNKGTRPEIAKIYFQIAEQEAGHAQSLFKIGELLTDPGDEKYGLTMAWGLVRDMLTDGTIKYNAIKQLYT